MWSRHRLDIGWRDLIAAAWNCFLPGRIDVALADVERLRSPDGEAVACLSVRSGLELLLAAQNWPAGGEVLFSAVTVPDMVCIAEHHGLIAVPLDLDADTLGPSPETLLRAVTPQTRAVVVAHLFGRRLDLQPLIAAAKSRGLFFIEDCAQAFAGGEFPGHQEADASLFSFGPIKTATALGGAVLRVADESLRNEMRARQRDYPRQSRWSFFRRAWKSAALKFVASRFVNGLLIRGCRLFGRSYDQLIGGAVRGFSVEFEIAQFRCRPSTPLLSLLRRRLRRYSMERLARRAKLGRRLLEAITPTVPCPGSAAGYHDFWLFPVFTDRPDDFTRRLRAAGFDTARPDSLCAVSPPSDRPELKPTTAQDLLERIVFVPMYPELSDRAVAKLADAICRFESEFM